MPFDVLILIATGCLAIVALVAAVVSLRNLKEIRATVKGSAQVEPVATEPTVSEPQVMQAASIQIEASEEPELLEPAVSAHGITLGPIIAATQRPAPTPDELVPHHGQVARVVDGKVVVTPTRAQVATAIMGQPRVRFAIWATGIAHALRPESRDRIMGMMRRDYVDRRRHREQAARAAIRAAHSPATRPDEGLRS